MLPAEYPRHRPEPSTLFPCHAWFCRLGRPLFGRGEAAVAEALIPANLLAIGELVEPGAPEGQEHAALLPLPQPAPARRRTPVPRRQFAPRRPRPEDPENALKTPARVGPGPASSRGALLTRQLRSNPLPLRVGESSPGHTSTLSSPPYQSQVLK